MIDQNGDPIPMNDGYIVAYNTIENAPFLGFYNIDEQGRQTIVTERHNHPDGTYELQWIQKSMYDIPQFYLTPITDKIITIDGDTDVTIQVYYNNVTLTLVNQNGDPIPGADLTLPRNDNPSYSGIVNLTTDNNGQVVFSLKPDTYSNINGSILTGMGYNTYMPLETTEFVVEGTKNVEITLTATRVIKIEVNVYAPDLTPVTDAEVWIDNMAYGVSVNENGQYWTYDCQNMLVGEFNYSVNSPTFGSAHGTLTAENEDIIIDVVLLPDNR